MLAVEHRARIVGMPKHETEASRIVESQHAVAEQEVDVIVHLHALGRRHQAQRPGHAEMDDQRAAPLADRGSHAADQNELSPSRDGLDRHAGERRRKSRRDRATQARVPDDDRVDAAPDDAGGDAANGHFDFRQFRHPLFQGPEKSGTPVACAYAS